MKYKTTYVPGGQGRGQAGMLCGAILLCAVLAGCNQSSTEATGIPAAPQHSSTVKVAASLLAQSGIRSKPVTREAFRTFRDFPGTVKANDNNLAEITTLVRGRLVEVYKDIGENVKAGERLALLFSRELGLAQAGYLKAIAGLRVAEQSFNRAKYLLDDKVMGQGEFQRREGQLISARADANESNNRLKLLGMTAPDIAALERSQTIKSHIPILAPLSGRIIGRNVTKGEVVETTRHLFTIADLATIWVVASVSEQDFAFIHRNVHEAMTAEVLLTAYPNQPIVGKVTYVGDVLDPDTRTLALRIEMANPDGRLKPEMFATVRIQAPDEPDVIAVPSMAIQRDRGQTVVFVQLNDDEFSRRIVELGDRNGDHVRVMNGLQEGDRVVVDGAYVVKSEFANQHRGGVAE